MDISVVIPVYGCRKAIPELYERLCNTLEKIVESFEIIMVEDNCPEKSWEDINKLCAKDDRVVGIKFSRNFGQIRAITAGLDSSCGDWIVVMDCDLQDRPEAIEELYNKAKEGYDVVFAERKDRKDKAITKFLGKAFYKVYDAMTDGCSDNTIGNFSISSRRVIDEYCKLREHNRDYPTFIKWLGFDQIAIPLEAEERFSGKSSYNMRRKLKMAFEIITAQSNKPLRISVEAGFIIAFLAFVYIIYLIIRSLAVGDFPEGYASTIASIYLMGGLILMAVGIAGMYVGNIFDEVKNRPLYIVDEKKNIHKK